MTCFFIDFNLINILFFDDFCLCMIILLGLHGNCACRTHQKPHFYRTGMTVIYKGGHIAYHFYFMK